MFKKPSFKTAMIICCATVVVLFATGAGVLFKTVKNVADRARSTYGGDHVGALIALVEDDTASFDQRNSAIWALGQIGDQRALSTLRALDTDEIQTPPYDTSQYIAQYYVEKAIQEIVGFSKTRWMYRFL